MEPYEWIYLSPHLDDAALSCGGQIYQATQRGERVLIVTVTAGDPGAPVSEYAASLHARWELVNATQVRRQEDLAACAILGAQALHWQVPDCIYRVNQQGAPYYVSDADIFGAVAPSEMGLVDELAAQMRGLLSPRHVVAPLTAGQHVDHRLTRLAAEQAFPHQSLLYYEDYPYAQQPGKLAQVIDQGTKLESGESKGQWAAEVVWLDEGDLRAKFDAVAAFRSQLSTFFRDRADLEAQIGGYAAAIANQSDHTLGRAVERQSANLMGAERRWRALL